MRSCKGKYVNPFTDFGFKKLFGEEPNKNLLLDFLNELLKEEQGEIKEISYLKSENLGRTATERIAIFDLYCINERGERFIVELQKTKQKFFKDRSIYYSTFPIVEQVKKGDWNFKLEKVYIIAILDFEFDEDKKYPDKFKYNVKLSEIETKEVFSDKLNFIYLEMPKFKKSIDELETRFEKWLYIIKNLTYMETIPTSLEEETFLQLFEVAELANLTEKEIQSYEDSLKIYRDLKNSLDTAEEEGLKKGKREGLKEGIKKGKREGLKEGLKKGKKEGIKEGIAKGKIEGIKEGKIDNAIKMLNLKMDISLISEITGLTEEEIRKL